MTRPTAPPEIEARVDRVRALCMALPEAFEKLAWGEATFRAGEKGKMFATFAAYHHDDRVAAWLKAADGAQAILVASNPAHFFVPPYQGPAGWVGVYLDADEPDWDELATLIEDAFRLVAPKKLLTALEARQA